MTRRRSIIGLSVLCALALCALISSSAQAQVAITCAPSGGPPKFSDAHCKTPNESGTFGKVAIAEKVETEITATNGEVGPETKTTEASKLAGTLSGIETELECTGLSGTGVLINAATTASGTGTIVYSGCTVTKPAGRGCKVKGGSVTTKELKASNAGLTNQLLFEPKAGTTFAEITLENCLNNKPPNETYPVSGSVLGNTTGATTSTTIAKTKEEGKTTFGGNPAGIEGTLTIRMKGGNPIYQG